MATPEKIAALIQGLEATDFIPEQPNGNTDAGFTLLAGVMYLIISNESVEGGHIEHQELLDHITDNAWGFPGRSGDGGIDGHYTDDESETIHIFQSKYLSENDTTSVGPDASDFKEVPQRLFQESFYDFTNDAIKEFSEDYQEKIFDDSSDYKIKLHFITTSTVNTRTKNSYKNWSNTDLILRNAEGKSKKVTSEAIIWDFEKINERYETWVGTEVNVRLNISPEKSIILKQNHTITLVTFLKVTELIRIYKKYGFNLFRENPRGPLGNIKTNKEIIRTIEDDNKKPLFHILNNGLSIVCEALNTTPIENWHNQNSMRILPSNNDSDQYVDIKIRNMQIVNGLQTTHTLKITEPITKPNFYKDTYVLAKITEAADVRHEIAVTSNSQSPIKGWDFISQNQIHKNLHSEFKESKDKFRFYYEIRRGGYSSELPENQKDNNGNKLKKISPKQLTQSMVAFHGDPITAKDQIRTIEDEVFNNGNKFKNLYPDGITATHVMFVHSCWLYVYEKERKERFHREEFNRTNQDRPIEANDWFSYARYYMVAMIGEAILRQESVHHINEISDSDIAEMYDNNEDRFDKYYDIAYDAIKNNFDTNKRAATMAGIRFENRQEFKIRSKWNEYLARFNTNFIDL